MTVYSSTPNQWPLLQRKTEQKFKNGLIAVSASYITPHNQSTSISSVPSSIGDLTNIYPPPTHSTDSSGFIQINATAYGIWEPNAAEEYFMPTRALLHFLAIRQYSEDTDGDPSTPPVQNSDYLQMTIPVTAESGYVKKLVSTIPTLSRPLAILGQKTTWSCQEVFGIGPTTPQAPVLIQWLNSVRTNNFGSIQETEASYNPEFNLNFGTVIL